MRLLLVEDDRLLGEGLCTGLQQGGYAVDWFADGMQAKRALEGGGYDAVVLDLSLPGCDGLEIVQWLRRQEDDTPVLILTARDAIGDRINGLDLGADDYMVKPFDLDELAARLRALLRRSSGRSTPEIRLGDLVLDPAAHEVRYRGEIVDLSPREFALLHRLLDSAGKVVTKTRLMESVYGWDQELGSNALEVHIHHLRKKLDSSIIATVRGVGYALRIEE